MEQNASPDTRLPAELAAQVPPPPPDEANDAIVFAKKTMRSTLILSALFIGAAVVWIFVLHS